jgi:hypothetical protein
VAVKVELFMNLNLASTVLPTVSLHLALTHTRTPPRTPTHTRPPPHTNTHNWFNLLVYMHPVWRSMFFVIAGTTLVQYMYNTVSCVFSIIIGGGAGVCTCVCVILVRDFWHVFYWVILGQILAESSYWLLGMILYISIYVYFPAGSSLTFLDHSWLVTLGDLSADHH